MANPEDEETGDAHSTEADRVWTEFMAALDTMAPETRAAFLLHEVFEASYDEIARLIGLPADICRSRIEHARASARMQRPGKKD